ncbi:hypothetical protein [Ferruginibacter sp. SUN106]|uniref:hypothetical protein n=1 Tax=Ferruginibacter sp. SUN106 TaxID=2978348 RepID=UPI003D36F087
MIINLPPTGHQIKSVTNFKDLVATPFTGAVNAICWDRTLKGDFAEIVNKIPLDENINILNQEELGALQLSEQGQLARDIILNDWQLLTAHGAAPVLNLIRCYDRDDANSFFPTDVYSFHADRSPVPTDTFLCTYYGAPSQILPNAQAQQKVWVPEIRAALKKQYGGAEEGFEAFLSDHFFDLHYQATPGALPVSLGVGNLWRLAIDHPESQVLPCIHRAPEEKNGQPRLLLIC